MAWLVFARDSQGAWPAWEKKKTMRTVFWWGIMKEKGHLQDPCIDWRMILKWTVKKGDWGVGTGFIWLKVRESPHIMMTL